MAILTNIVAADDGDAEAIAASLSPCDEWSGIERRGLDIAKIVTLHCLLTGEDFDLAAMRHEPLAFGDDGALVLHLAEESLLRLAELDEEAVGQVADELAQTEAFEQAPWDADAALDLVADLAELARLAESQDQQLYVWLHPLLT